MDFLKLLTTYLENFDKSSNKRAAWQALKTEYDILQIKKEKLKLGKVLFEIHITSFGDIVLYEEVEMIYCRQDTTYYDSQNLQLIYKSHAWKWDLKNIGAVCILGCFLINYLWTAIDPFFYMNLIFSSWSDSNSFSFLLKLMLQLSGQLSINIVKVPLINESSLSVELLSEMIVFLKLI